MDFEKFIRRGEKSLTFGEVIKFLTQIINQLRVLRDKGIYPVLEMDGLFVSEGKVKMKVKKTITLPQNRSNSRRNSFRNEYLYYN